MKHQIKAGINNLSISKFIMHVRYIISMLAGNPNFPNLPYPIPEMEGEVNSLDTLSQQVTAGNRLVKGSRDEVFISLKKKVSATALYVNAASLGSITALESSGFELVKTPSPKPVPETISKLECININPMGSAKVSWRASKERDFYVLEKRVGEGPDAVWEEVEHTTKTHCIVTGLEFRQDVYFRVSAVNSAGRSLWSDVAMLVVQ